MARSSRGGLGRGLGALMGASVDNNRPKQRTQERELVEYTEDDESLYPTGEIKLPNTTGNISATENVSRETPIEEQEVVIRETASSPLVEDTKPDTTTEEVVVDGPITELPINFISPNPDQPRTNFNERELEELANSIKRNGLIQPILVRKIDDENYQIVAGERRWQASNKAGLEKVPVHFIEADDDEALELALIENLQRSDLNPIEEAYGYKRLMDKRKMTQADVAQAMSKGRSTIANALRLLELPESAQQLLFEDRISAGHARAILSIPSKEGRESLTKKLSEEKLSVRDAENLAKLLSNKPSKKKKSNPTPAAYKTVAKALREVLDTNVRVRSTKGKNKIEIEFKDENDLERLFNLIIDEDK